MEVSHRKKKKKLSHDNHRVIKFSTGEPYLEYLPNMLSKDTKVRFILFRTKNPRVSVEKRSFLIVGSPAVSSEHPRREFSESITRTFVQNSRSKNFDIFEIFQNCFPLIAHCYE